MSSRRLTLGALDSLDTLKLGEFIPSGRPPWTVLAHQTLRCLNLIQSPGDEVRPLYAVVAVQRTQSGQVLAPVDPTT